MVDAVVAEHQSKDGLGAACAELPRDGEHAHDLANIGAIDPVGDNHGEAAPGLRGRKPEDAPRCQHHAVPAVREEQQHRAAGQPAH